MFRALTAFVKSLYDLVKWMLMSPFYLARWICQKLGMIEPDAPASAQPTVETPEEVIAEQPKVGRGHLPGDSVHEYARALPDDRASLDFVNLDPHQIAWVLGLSDSDLARLAMAGPEACQRAVTGHRSGIVGLPLMTRNARADTRKVEIKTLSVSDYDYVPMAPAFKMSA